MRRNAGAPLRCRCCKTTVRTPVPLHVIEGVGYGAALHGWRLEYQDALPPCEWALAKARERGSNFHIVCLLFIRGLGLGNFGRLSDSLADLREGMQLSEINHERYWLPRLPNTLAWLHSEMFDVEEALRLNREGSIIAREMNFPEGDANSQINLALNYLSLDDANSAREHLHAAETLLAQDEWFRWVYTIRFQAAYAESWLMKGDPAEAARYATLRSISPASHAVGSTSRGRTSCSATWQPWRTDRERPLRTIRQGFPSWNVTRVRPFSGRFWLPLPPFIPSSINQRRRHTGVRPRNVLFGNSPGRSGKGHFRLASGSRESHASLKHYKVK